MTKVEQEKLNLEKRNAVLETKMKQLVDQSEYNRQHSHVTYSIMNSLDSQSRTLSWSYST